MAELKVITPNKPDNDPDVFIRMLNSPEMNARREAAWEAECRRNDIRELVKNTLWMGAGAVTTLIGLIAAAIL